MFKFIKNKEINNKDLEIEIFLKNNYIDPKDYFENEEIILSNNKNTFNNIDTTTFKFPKKTFDIVVGGGGFKGFYNIGAFEIIKQMIVNSQIKIRYWTGVSSGAYVCVFTILGIQMNIIKNMYRFAKKNKFRHDINNILSKICNLIFPSNAHELCNGKLRILVSEFTIKGLIPVIIDKFESKEHLIKILQATSFIPFLTTNDFHGIKINGKKYFDGAFTNNTPIIYKNDLPQLVFTTSAVKNSEYLDAFKITDFNPDNLILKGMNDIKEFILNLESNNKNLLNYPIKWIPSKTKKINNQFIHKKLDTATHLILNILIIVTFIYGHIFNFITKIY
jgi:hypothetical protein